MHSLLSAHFSKHLGLIASRQCPEVGLTYRQVERMIASGDLIPVHRGVHRHAAAPVTFEQRILAGLLAAGDDAVVSHRTALKLHGARNFDCMLVELTKRTTSVPLRSGLIVHRSSTLASADIRRTAGFWVTTAERSLVDAAAVMSPFLVRRYAEEWLASKVVIHDRLMAAIDRAGNHPGAHRLRRALAAADITDADSVAEGRLGQILDRAGIAAMLHWAVTTSSGYSFELDWAYPSHQVGLELDGYGVHLRSHEAFDDDRFRRNELEADGWRILNTTVRQLRRNPGRVVDQVRRMLARVELTTGTVGKSTRPDGARHSARRVT